MGMNEKKTSESSYNNIKYYSIIYYYIKIFTKLFSPIQMKQSWD